MTATSDGDNRPPQAGAANPVTAPDQSPNAFKIKISFVLTQTNELSGTVTTKDYGSGAALNVDFSDLFKVPTFRHSLFVIDSEIKRSIGSVGAPDNRSFTIRSSLAYVMFANNRELVAYDVEELKEAPLVGSASPGTDHWKPFLPARYACRDLTKEHGSNAEYACKIAEAYNVNPPDQNAWWNFAGHMDQVWTLTPEAKPLKFKVEGILTLRRHLLGEFACVAPIPPFGDPGTMPNHAVVSGGTDANGERTLSELVQETLHQLTHALRGRDNQIIWIMGEPGSGKEVFAQALHYGSLSGRTKSRLPPERSGLADFLQTDPGFRAESVAGIGIEEFNHRLFTVRSEQPAPSGSSAAGPPGKTLLEDAEGGGTIFLDEFDKPSRPAEIYDSLLRVLEAKRYIKRTVQNTHTITTPQQYKKVNWIFAGAFTQKDLKLATPPDLWSRLTGFLKTHNFVVQEDYAISLFLFFYLRTVVDIFSSKKEIDGILKVLGSDDDEIASVVKALLGMQRDEKLIAPAPFSPKKPLLDLAFRFYLTIKIKPVFEGDRADSARAIRQAAKAIFDRLRDAAIEDSKFELNSAQPIHKKAIEEAIQNGTRALMLARGP